MDGGPGAPVNPSPTTVGLIIPLFIYWDDPAAVPRNLIVISQSIPLRCGFRASAQDGWTDGRTDGDELLPHSSHADLGCRRPNLRACQTSTCNEVGDSFFQCERIPTDC